MATRVHTKIVKSKKVVSFQTVVQRFLAVRGNPPQELHQIVRRCFVTGTFCAYSVGRA